MTSGEEEQRWDVFLAHAGPDKPRARVLKAELEALGLTVCFDEDVLRPGDNWHVLLPRYVRASNVVVALMSERTGAAHYEASELVVAVDLVRREGGRLVPVHLAPGLDAPYGTEHLHRLDMFDEADAAAVAASIAEATPRTTRTAAMSSSRIFCDRIPVAPRFFTGREGLLERLEAEGRPGATVTLQGMGGVGKTAVAAVYAESQRRARDVVWWVRADEPSTLEADLAELAGELGITAGDTIGMTAQRVRRWLEGTSSSWLLVLDNALDAPSIDPWRPKRGGGTVLITSRTKDFGALGVVTQVDPLPDELAANFLVTRVQETNPAAAAADLSPVLSRLAGLPLALEQAGAWVGAVGNRTFARYATMFDDASKDPFPGDTRPLGYEHTAATTWRVSLDAAMASAPRSALVLGALAHLAPDPVPISWLRTAAPRHLPTGESVDVQLDALDRHSLVTIGPDDTVSVHRAVASMARRTAGEAAVDLALGIIEGQVASASERPSAWPLLRAAGPHARALAHGSPRAGGALVPALTAVSRAELESGDPRAAIATAALAVRLAEDALGPEHPLSLASRSNLAHAHDSAGEPATAVPLYAAVLLDGERILGPDHPDTLATRNNLAGALYTSGRVEEATDLYAANLDHTERTLGPDHPDTLATRNNLAAALKTSGRVDEAIHLYAANLDHTERTLGPDHPDTLATRNDLASACRAAGDLASATALFERTLADRTRILGPDHPDTLVSRNNLAIAYQTIGDLDRALVLHESNLYDTTRLLGPAHPTTLSVRNNLANAYQSRGDLDRSIPLYEATLADAEGVLGRLHPNTLTSRSNLARAYELVGRTDAAKALFRTVLGDSERALGPSHPTVTAIRENLVRLEADDGHDAG